MSTRISLFAAVLVTVLLLPATAWAAPRGALVSPGKGAVVASPVELRVQVTRDVLEPDAARVRVRLSQDGSGAAAGSRAVSLSCLSGCGTRDALWGGPVYDPATAAPFGAASACNGRWYLQVSVDGGSFGSGTPIVASAPASPARNVRVAIDGRDAVVTWGRAGEPDVAVHRIERRTEGGSWSEVGEVPADATSFTDRDVDEGSYEWRVVTLRGDGRKGGGPAAPCADREPDLATVSSGTRGRVTEPPPPPSPSPTETPDGTEQPSEGTGTPGDGSEGDGASSGDGGAPGDGATSGDGTAPPTGATSDGASSSGAPAVDGGTSPDGEPTAASPSEEVRYYGEGHGLGALDYGEVSSDSSGATAAGGTWVPGGVSVATERNIDRVRLLRPIAGGMIMLTFAFHIRRWQREHDV